MGQGLHSHRYSRTVVPALHAEVRNIFEGVVEAVCEIGRADGQGQLDDLSFVVELAHFLKLGGAATCSAVTPARFDEAMCGRVAHASAWGVEFCLACVETPQAEACATWNTND